jgi:type II secretory pathway component GspD/PulD (secretin)
MLTALAAAQEVSSPPSLSLAAGTYRLMVTERAVSLEAQEASIAAIVADISRRTGIPIVIYPGVDERITIHLTQVALAEALKRLAPNVAIVPAQGMDAPPHRIAKVYVFAKGQARTTVVDTRPPQREGATSPQAETANNAVARPTPFQFTFDPSQYMQRSP